MIKLQIHSGNRSPVSVDLPRGVYSLGADERCAIVVDRPGIGPEQLEITVTEQYQVFVRNLSDADDLSVDGQRQVESFVAPGELVVAGGVVVTVEFLGVPGDAVTATETGERVKSPCSLWSFYAMILRAFGYPLDGDCLFVLASLGLLIGISSAFVGLVGIGLGLLVGFYLLTMFREIVLSTIRGEDRMPNEPSFSFSWDELREFVVPIYAIVLFPMLPFILVRYWTDAPDWLRPTLGVIALCYIPMGMLLLIVTDEFWAAHPINVVRSVLRAPGGYLGIVLLFSAIVWVGSLIDFSESEIMRSSRILRIILGTVLHLVECYVLFVWARALGLYYRWYRQSLQWEA